MASLAILGAGGHGRVVADCAEQCGWTDIVFFADNPAPIPNIPWPLLGTTEVLLERLTSFDGFVVGVGDNGVRLGWHHRLIGQGGRSVTLVHPRATVSGHSQLGDGTVVFSGACINIGARVGVASIVNTNATIEHDCDLGDGVHVSPGAALAGGVRVGPLAWIGVGASVRQGIVIGKNSRVGAGAAVVRSVGEDETVVGVPARTLQKRTDA